MNEKSGGESVALNVDGCVDLYITLCSHLCKETDDYTKERVKEHNVAMKKLNELRDSIKSVVNTLPCFLPQQHVLLHKNLQLHN